MNDAADVVVLAGADDVFCRGMELRPFGAGEELRESVESFAVCLDVIRKGDKPVIAFVQGQAAGGGVGLAAACDGVLAATGASFTLSELLFGLTPAVILPYLAQRVNLQKLRWMGLTAGTLTGQEAVEAGLADAVCPPEKAPAILRSWIRKLRRIERKTVGAWKRMTIQAPLPGSKDGIEFTLGRLADPAVRERLRTFLETGELPLGESWMKE